MRITLKNYLSLQGYTIDGLAQQLGRSRETIRRWRDNPELTSIVDFDPVNNKVDHLEIGKLRIIKAVHKKSPK